MAPPTTKSRIYGSLHGVAVVDALGGPVEFMSRGSFDDVTGFAYNYTFNVPPGAWTDDTSMTLCLAQSLVANNGKFVSQAAIRNYIDWYKHGYLSATNVCFDIGAGTRIALGSWKKFFDSQKDMQRDDPHGHEGGQQAIDKSLKRDVFCGNGSLMRVSPIGLVFFNDIDLALRNAALSSDVTHPFPRCAECCMIYTKMIVHAMNGMVKPDLAKEIANTTIADAKLREKLEDYKSIKDWEETSEDKIKSSGYVLSTLEAALWAFFTTDTFKDGALKAVNLGYDADTVGAVYGGLAGAYYGMEAIPREWVEGLMKGSVIEEIAFGLASVNQS